MIDFSLVNYHGHTYNDEDVKQYHYLCGVVFTELGKIKQDKFRLGVCLNELYQSKSYRVLEVEYLCDIGDFSIFNCNSKLFFYGCKQKFDLDKGTVSRYMNIVSEFGNSVSSDFAPKWQPYSYSQLVEMLPLTSSERDVIKPDWTIKRIRDYKKSLVATSQPDDTVSEVVPEEKPIDEKYERFAKYSKNDVIDYVYELESKLAKFEALLSAKLHINDSDSMTISAAAAM